MSMLPNLSSLNKIADGLVESISRGGEELKNRVMKISESARLVKNATNNLHWGPTGPQMRQIADITFQHQECTNIMQAIWERLHEVNSYVGASNWRNIYKTLLLLDYIMKNGSEIAVNDARMNLHQIKGLVVVHYVDPEGVDRGVSIRERAKLIVDLLSDTNRLREERKKAKSNRDKYGTSYSSTQGWTKSYTGGSTGIEEIDIEDEHFSGPSAGERDERWEEDVEANEADDFQFRPGQSLVKETPSSVPTVSTAQTEWDPFGITSGGAKEDDWADWSTSKETPAQTNSWPSTPTPYQSSSSSSIFGAPAQSSTVSMPPIVDLVGSSISVVIPAPEPSPAPTPSAVQPPTLVKPTTPATSQPSLSPVKPNDPWAAHSHLFDLSLSSKDTFAPSLGKPLSTSGKPLGSTIGTGWGPSLYTPTPTPGAFPGAGYAVSAAYPAGYVTGYATGGAYPTTGVYPQPTQTTAQWGI